MHCIPAAHRVGGRSAEVCAVPLRQLGHLLTLQEICDLQNLRMWAPQPEHFCRRADNGTAFATADLAAGHPRSVAERYDIMVSNSCQKPAL